MTYEQPDLFQTEESSLPVSPAKTSPSPGIAAAWVKGHGPDCSGRSPGWWLTFAPPGSSFENVPGLLSATCPCPGTGEHNDCTEPHQITGGACPGGCFPAHGGAMGLVLGALADLGYGFAYRVLDAQHLGVPQRRRRVFIVGRAGGDSRGPVQVLLEPEGRAGDSAAGGEAGAGSAGGSTVSTLQGGGERGYRIDAEAAAAGGHLIPVLADTLRSHPRPGSNSNGALVTATVSAKWAKGTGGPSGDEAQNLVPVAFDTAQSVHGSAIPVALRGRDGGSSIEVGEPGDPAFTVRTTGGGSSYPMVAHTLTGEGHDPSEDGTGRGTPIVPMAFNPKTGGDMRIGYGEKPTALSCTQETAVHIATAVRRLTPLECERLQGFPDRWTATSNGKAQADAARYRQCGNAIAVPAGGWVVGRVVRTDARERQAADLTEGAAA